MKGKNEKDEFKKGTSKGGLQKGDFKKGTSKSDFLSVL